MANNEQKIKIQLEVYDVLIEVITNKGEEKKILSAAKFVTDRLDTYTKRFKEERCQHTISIMTMLDIALNPMLSNEREKERHSLWRKIIAYFKS